MKQSNLYGIERNIKSHPSWVCGLKQVIIVIVILIAVSHPSWVCGLKLKWEGGFVYDKESHPSWVCGLKPVISRDIRSGIWSHPSWVCGLKLASTPATGLTIESHPSWVCGLKQQQRSDRHERQCVTPFVGVWIETFIKLLPYVILLCHTLRGCVD